MAKIKKEMKWDNCPYALFPFGKGAPICSYGVEPKEDISLKDFHPCMQNKVCLKEQEK